MTSEEAIYYSVKDFSIPSLEATVSLVHNIKHVINKNIPGAFVECGVYRGGSAIAMIKALQLYNATDREIYLYDSFEGMPEPDNSNIDVEIGVGPALDQYNEHKGKGGWLTVDFGEVVDRLLFTKYPTDNIRILKGLVEDTIPAFVPTQIALARFDTDYYKSTKHEF